MSATPRLVLVTGPTGAGKSELALGLAEQLGGEIVGADSIQLYRRLDIGSAKPTAAERARVPHHLVDRVDPRSEYTAADFAEDAAQAVDEIAGRGAVPIVVGGSALYQRALLRGICEAPGSDPAIREDLATRAEVDGWPALHAELSRLDPDTAARIHPNDRIRIERALEVVLASGQSLSAHQRGHGELPERYPSLKLGVNIPREALYERIDRRVLAMVDAGWFAEVEALLSDGYDPGLKPLQAIGYRDVVAHLRGEREFEEAIRRIQRDTRRFAKRQLTWFRKDRDVNWYRPRVGLAGELADAVGRFHRGEDPDLPAGDESAKP
ncbi:MAG: tRNA (adenosine(37)-N6)-dimethylallyltransferase MiaA [Myxococcota bacterium]|nr:tRNA (adenosine(37)-N6)-dimethylallyltransferase MiaA [Myxococcota bacterium]